MRESVLSFGVVVKGRVGIAFDSSLCAVIVDDLRPMKLQKQK